MASASFSLLLPLSSSCTKALALIAPPSPRVASPPKAICCPLWSARQQRATVVVRRVSLSSSSEEVAEPTFSKDLELYVGNLPYSVDSAQLAGLFSEAGIVERVVVLYHKLTGRSRGFGFVTMSTVEEVEVAIQKFNGYKLEGRQLAVRTGPPPTTQTVPSRFHGDANRVFVDNLSSVVDVPTLESLFSEQGNVVDARIIYDRYSGGPSGYGFVTYSSAEEAANAISALNGINLHGLDIRVRYADRMRKHRVDV